MAGQLAPIHLVINMDQKTRSTESLRILPNKSEQVIDKSEHVLPKNSHDSGIGLDELWFEPSTSASRNLITDYGISSTKFIFIK